jgi:hypothetical protein
MIPEALQTSRKPHELIVFFIHAIAVGIFTAEGKNNVAGIDGAVGRGILRDRESNRGRPILFVPVNIGRQGTDPHFSI